MRVHPPGAILELKRLRAQGFSINELVGQLRIPKTTVWHHVHKIQVPPPYLHILEAKRGGSTKHAAKRREQARVIASQLLSGASREKAVALAMLYWGEGSKRTCEFINSDGAMIQCYLYFIRTALGIPDENIRPTLRYFGDMDRSICLRYWSRVTRIPPRKFIVRYNDGGTRGKTRYGLCRITVLKGSNTLKVIHSLIEQLEGELCPRSSTD